MCCNNFQICYFLLFVLVLAVQCERKPILNSDDVLGLENKLNNDPFKSKLSEDCDFSFKMEFPTSDALSMDYVYELATRLLFHSIDWARVAPSFNKLQNNDQISLLQSAWCDLFLLSLVQCAQAFPLESTLALMVQEVQKYSGIASHEATLDHINKVKDLLFTLDRLNLAGTEFALLKFICLFNPGKWCLLAETVQKIHDLLSLTYKCRLI